MIKRKFSMPCVRDIVGVAQSRDDKHISAWLRTFNDDDTTEFVARMAKYANMPHIAEYIESHQPRPRLVEFVRSSRQWFMEYTHDGVKYVHRIPCGVVYSLANAEVVVVHRGDDVEVVIRGKGIGLMRYEMRTRSYAHTRLSNNTESVLLNIFGHDYGHCMHIMKRDFQSCAVMDTYDAKEFAKAAINNPTAAEHYLPGVLDDISRIMDATACDVVISHEVRESSGGWSREYRLLIKFNITKQYRSVQKIMATHGWLPISLTYWVGSCAIDKRLVWGV